MRVIPAYRGPKKVLREIMREVYLKVHLYQRDCWNISIELIANRLGIITNPWKYSLPDLKWTGTVCKPSYHGFQQLKEQISETLIDQYIEEAKADPWDYPGDVFEEEELAGRNRLGQIFTPRGVVEMMVQMTLGMEIKKPYSFQKPDFATRVWLTEEALKFNDKLAEISINLQAERARWHTVLKMRPLLIKYDQEPISDLDPTVGTGRFLIVASQLYPKTPLLLYGVEIDLSLYRACLVNMAMFSNHPYSILCVDSLRLGLNEPWQLGNQWDPPDISPYYFKPCPIDSRHFSLKYFTEHNLDQT
jgi:hypothetical protein